MNINTEKMCSNEIRKIGIIIDKMSEIGWDLSGYGEGGVNQSSGNVYIWLEDYPVTPYIGLSGDKVRFLFSCPECGEELDIDEKNVIEEKYPNHCEFCKKDF